jgi:hypothetical protein
MGRRAAFWRAVVTDGLRWAREVLSKTLLLIGALLFFLGVGVSGVLVGKPAWFIGTLAAAAILLILSEGAFHAWVDAKNQPRPASAPFEEWLEGRIDAAAVIARERRVRGDEWFTRASGDWDVENVQEMAGYDEQGNRLGDGLAPELVDDYRRDPRTGQIGVPPPHGLAEYEAHFERGVAWLKQALFQLRGREL